MLNPTLEPTVAGIADKPGFERQLADAPALLRLRGAIGAAELSLQVDPETGRIVAAGHQGALDRTVRVLLNLLCETLTGDDLGEAAAHAAARVLHAVAGQATRPPVAGVLLPGNGGRVFLDMERALRGMRAEFQARRRCADPLPVADENDAWSALTQQVREERLLLAISRYIAENSLPDDAIQFEMLEDNVMNRPVRAVLSFTPRCGDGNSLPAFIRALERRLKRDLGTGIEVLAAERQDRNRLRRMILVKNAPPNG